MMRRVLVGLVVLGSVASAAPIAPLAQKAVVTLAPTGAARSRPLGWFARRVGRVHDTVLNWSGAAVGYFELYTGFRYAVTPSFEKVSDTLTRGSRRSPEELKAMANEGFRGIISLTAERTDDRATVERLGMRYLRLPIVDNTAPTRRQMMRMLDFLSELGDERVYVHCEAGKGRTGVAVAVYRMAVQGWTAEQAIAEGKGFGLRIPAQIAFVEKFGRDLEAGRIKGYPLRSTTAPL
jgi:protein tyrosine phosphatase (PTP) superfamily phosphohydrolase (DUF442 family)